MINNIFSSVTPLTWVCWLLGFFPYCHLSGLLRQLLLSFSLAVGFAYMRSYFFFAYSLPMYRYPLRNCNSTGHLGVYAWVSTKYWPGSYQAPVKTPDVNLSSLVILVANSWENPARILWSSARSWTWCSDTLSRPRLSSLRCVGVQGVLGADPHPQLLAHDWDTKRKSHASFIP